MVGAHFSIVVYGASTIKWQRREIRSYVLRQGRITRGQTRAFDLGWPVYGLNSVVGMLDFETTFGRSAPTVLEIGFGMGDSFAAQAKFSPEKNFIGVEVHKPGVGHLLMKVIEKEITNIRVYKEDSRKVLRQAIPEDSLQTVQVFFPDPWPKKRHRKRRLVGLVFLDVIASKLKPGGLVHIVTDWVPYAEEVEKLLASRSDFGPVEIPHRPETKFERRGRKLGHEVRDLAYRLYQ